MKRTHELGMANPLLITAIVLSVLTVSFGAFSIWTFLNYSDQKNNVDAKISVAVTEAKAAQTKEDQATFTEQEKLPVRQIVGPADLGQVTFSYPKTWSVYIDKSSSTAYEAYFYPLTVPPITSGTPYALRVSILDGKYDAVLASFNERLKNGNLTASPVTIAGVDGMRLNGTFSTSVKGSMVLFKIRDKTLEVYTQSQSYQTDFDSTVLATLQFNK